MATQRRPGRLGAAAGRGAPGGRRAGWRRVGAATTVRLCRRDAYR
jgi:hypothetical protein